MSFLQWKKDKLKIGKITFFKVKSFQGMFIYYFLGIPVWSRTTPISRIIYEFQKNKNFDRLMKPTEVFWYSELFKFVKSSGKVTFPIIWCKGKNFFTAT